MCVRNLAGWERSHLDHELSNITSFVGVQVPAHDHMYNSCSSILSQKRFTYTTTNTFDANLLLSLPGVFQFASFPHQKTKGNSTSQYTFSGMDLKNTCTKLLTSSFECHLNPLATPASEIYIYIYIYIYTYW
jgi:hypothetical protein